MTGDERHPVLRPRRHAARPRGGRGARAAGDVRGVRRALRRDLAFEEWLAAYRGANGRLWAAYGRGEIGREELHRRRFADPLAAFGLDRGAADEVGAFYLERYRRAWRLNEGAEELLAAAAELGEVGILSNGFRELQRAKIARFELERWVRHVVLSEEVGAMKPARAIFDAAVRAACGERAARTGGGRSTSGDHWETDVLGAKARRLVPRPLQPRPAPAPRARSSTSRASRTRSRSSADRRGRNRPPATVAGRRRTGALTSSGRSG